MHPSAAPSAAARAARTLAPSCYRPVQSRRLASSLTTTFAAAPEVHTHSSSTSTASHGEPAHGTTPNAQGSAPTQAAGTPFQDAVVLVGFHPEEIQIIRQQLHEQLEQQPTRRKQSRKRQPAGEPQQQAAASRPGLPVVAAGRSVLTHTVEQLLTHVAQQQQPAQLQGDGEGYGADEAAAADTAVEHGRVVLLVGEGAQQRLGAPLNDWLAEWGVVPAIIAAYQQPRWGTARGAWHVGLFGPGRFEAAGRGSRRWAERAGPGWPHAYHHVWYGCHASLCQPFALHANRRTARK